MSEANKLKSTLSSIFRRKGGSGHFTRLFDDLDPTQAAFLTNRVQLQSLKVVFELRLSPLAGMAFFLFTCFNITPLSASVPPPITFAPPLSFSAGGGWGGWSACAADLNRDGKTDVVVTVSALGSWGICVLMGNGDGTFQAGLFTPLPLAPSCVALDDFNCDGKLDLAVSAMSDWAIPMPGFGEVYLLLGNGDGTFQSPTAYTAGHYCSSLAVADLDGDGKLDIVVTSQATVVGLYYEGSVVILLGNGDGTFRKGGESSVGINPQAVYVNDLNSDGKQDLVVANSWDGTITVLLGNGDGTFLPGFSYATGGGATSIIGADFNRDGAYDLAVLNFNSADVAIFLGRGDGTFLDRINYPGGLNNCFSITAADFNRDGKSDLALADLSGARVRVLTGNGDGTFQNAESVALNGGVQCVVAADVNCDGRCDLIASADGSILSLRNTTGDPSLDIARGDGRVTIRWPFPATGFVLETTTNILSRTWQSNTLNAVTNNGNWEVVVPLTERVMKSFFRLRKP